MGRPAALLEEQRPLWLQPQDELRELLGLQTAVWKRREVGHERSWQHDLWRMAVQRRSHCAEWTSISDIRFRLYQPERYFGNGDAEPGCTNCLHQRQAAPSPLLLRSWRRGLRVAQY